MLALVHTACIFFYKHSACIEHVTNTGEPLLPSHDVYVGQAADPACHCQRRGCLSSTSVVRFPFQGRLWHGSRQTGSGFSSPVRHYDSCTCYLQGSGPFSHRRERAEGATLERLRRLLAATVDGGGAAGAPPNRFEFRTLIFIAFTAVPGSAYSVFHSSHKDCSCRTCYENQCTCEITKIPRSQSIWRFRVGEFSLPVWKIQQRSGREHLHARHIF
jgi:hypothetical protein